MVGFQKSSSDRWRENEFMTRLKIRLIFEKKTKKVPPGLKSPTEVAKGSHYAVFFFFRLQGGEKNYFLFEWLCDKTAFRDIF